MKRKLIEQGKITLMISLPIDWVRRLELKKGDELEVEEQGSALVIKLAKKEVEVQKVEIDTTNIGRITIPEITALLDNLLSRYYKSGIDEIKIIYNDPEVLQKIQRRLSLSCLGYEIIKQEKNTLVIKDIAKGLEFETMLKQGFLVALDLAETSLKLIEKRAYAELNELLNTSRVTHFFYFSQRFLIKQKYAEYAEIPFLFTFLENLRNLVNLYRFLMGFIVKEKVKLNKNSVEAYQDVNYMFQKIYTLFYNYNLKEMGAFRVDSLKLIEKIRMLPSRSKEEFVIHHFLESITEASRRLSELLPINLSK
jgi:phosphate uptake regulator